MLSAFLDGAVFGTVEGDGPPRALLLHGWRRTHGDFDRAAGALAAEGVATVAIDLPGFGATPPPDRAMGARGYAEVVAPLVARLAVETGPVVLVGHSFGGRVAVCLAATRPRDVAAVVLSGAPLVRGALPAAAPSRRYQLVRALARAHLVSADTLEAARRRHGSADYRAASGVMRDVLVTCVQESYEPELDAISCPVTLVWGALDTAVPFAVAMAASAHFEHSALEVLDGVGHLVPSEAPDAIAGAILRAVRGAR